jgi:hypothetical protein
MIKAQSKGKKERKVRKAKTTNKRREQDRSECGAESSENWPIREVN